VRSNTNYCTETNIPSNNEIPVMLYNAAGVLIDTTLTASGNSWDTGYYSFPELPVGNYRVEINLPGGFVPQTATSAWRNLNGYGSPELLNFGYTRTEGRFMSGYAFVDVNANGSYDVGLDDPWAGADITVTTLSGTLIGEYSTASDGSFYVSPITSGEYRVLMTTPDLQLTRIAVIPASGGVPWVEFPLPPTDNRPRALVFLDSNQDGLPGPSEQRLGGVDVQLFSQQCGGIAAPVETLATNSDGLVLFTNLLSGQSLTNAPSPAAAAPGSTPGCVKIVTTDLPANTAPANLAGAAMPKNSGVPVLLPVYPQGTLLVQVFWDADGDGVADSGEPLLSSGTASIGGQTKSYSENGATFVLAEGSYSLNVVPPAGYQISTALPLTVVVGPGTTTRRIAARVAGGISGAVSGPDGALAGLNVRLTHLVSSQVYNSTSAYGCEGCSNQAFYQFTNLPGGQYRLSIPTPPPGHFLESEPVVTYTAGQALQQNLVLAPLGYLSGIVYLDENMNGQRDNGEGPATGYTVSLLNDNGLPVQTSTPDANGTYLFTNLTAGVRYLPSVDLFISQAASLSDSLTQAPGWFLPGMQPVQADIGISMGGTNHTFNTVFGRVTANGAGIAGVRIGYYHWAAGAGCNQSSPAWQNRETYSDINGDYKLLTWMLPGNEISYCIAARQPTGYQQNNLAVTGSNFSYLTTSGAIVYNPGYWEREITLVAAAVQSLSLAQGAAAWWSAFRDDNLNGVWDDSEPALPGVKVAGNSSGVVSGLANGLHTLAVTAPQGYRSQQGSSIAVWIHGADVVLPPLAFHFSGVLLGQAFADDDGDGRFGTNEKGVPGMAISLSGPAQASTVTGQNGRFSLPALPDGIYLATITPPAGYAPVAVQNVTLSKGGSIRIPLYGLKQISGTLYEDWDGDGQRSSDEPAVFSPITLQASNLGSTRTVLGSFRFGQVSVGKYLLTPYWQAAAAVESEVKLQRGSYVAFGAIPAGIVRGTAWLDSNNDGVRQAWEAPLAGVKVSLAGIGTTLTDQHGRYTFYRVPAGSYALSVEPVAGLAVKVGPVSVVEGRGAAFGLAFRLSSGYAIHLPVILR
jgi:hypothetical protein